MSEHAKAGHETLIATQWPLICQVWKAMREQLVAVQYENLLGKEPPPLHNIEVRQDPFDHSESLLGQWLHNGQMVGNIVIHANDQAFAEYDVVKPHPEKTAWFIEATTAWGSIGRISAELRLIPAI